MRLPGCMSGVLSVPEWQHQPKAVAVLSTSLLCRPWADRATVHSCKGQRRLQLCEYAVQGHPWAIGACDPSSGSWHFSRMTAACLMYGAIPDMCSEAAVTRNLSKLTSLVLCFQQVAHKLVSLHGSTAVLAITLLSRAFMCNLHSATCKGWMQQ